MPDWSYRTVLRPMLYAMGEARAQRLAIATLRTLARLPFGLAAIDFLGHMRADERLRTRCGPLELAGPIALGAFVDPRGEALAAFARFGVGMIEVIADDTNARHLETADVPVCVRIHDSQLIPHFEERAAMFIIPADAPMPDTRVPVLRADAGDPAGAAGVWLANADEARVRSLRARFPDAIVIAGGVIEPADARRLLDAGANVAVVDAGLVESGPGLIKRCNEALLSLQPPPSQPEPLSLDAARRAWFWAFVLGLAMFGGGVLAVLIGSTRVVLPYDESLCGMTRDQLARLNPRLLPFMAHDRISLAGTMLSLGILYAALAWNGIRRGAHWAHVTVASSAVVGIIGFFSFLGFGYFDPFHAFVTAILTQFTLLLLAMQPSPPQPPEGEWRETAAWRRGQWGQLLFIVMGAGLTGAGCVIGFIGCTSVFVQTDLEFMRTTAAELRLSYERLVPLVAHDRASLGFMLIASGITVWLSAQWGFRAGARWLWLALAWAGNIAFACAVIVHIAVGYSSPLHLAPAVAGAAIWNVALLLSREWLAGAQVLRFERPQSTCTT